MRIDDVATVPSLVDREMIAKLEAITTTPVHYMLATRWR
jgi:hypothetical protein